MPTVSQSGNVPSNSIPITIDNYTRAETDRTFGDEIKLNHCLGRFVHRRDPLPLDQQVVPRVNRDTLYSTAVFDLNAGSVTIAMPDPGKRFMSLIVIDEDHYVHGVYYGAGRHSFEKEEIGTRYVLAAFRTLVNPDDPNDMNDVHALQDAAAVEQPGGPGQFDVLPWDQDSLGKVREALMALSDALPDSRHAFGNRDEVDPIRHLIMTASAWGGNPEKDALYLNVVPRCNNGRTVYQMNVKDVPVDGFWSITVYNAKGYLEKNASNAYSFNNITARRDPDDSITIRFGGCDGKALNCLPIMPGWSYIVRLYRPRAEILGGKWKFPDAQPIQ